MESELILNRGGFPPLSARGCVQHLRPIETGLLRRTINGALIYAGKPLAHKYRSIIYCEDKASLALEGLWRGSEVRVGCIQQLWCQTMTREVLLERDPREGSVLAMTSTREEIEIQSVKGRKVIIADQSSEVRGLKDKGLEEKGSGEIFITYRPWLHMRINTFSLTTDEWGLKAGWRLELEEI
ncbi:MAG: hypothetical protein ACOH2E_06390 [Candidatus Paracaedibacter sp.]